MKKTIRALALAMALLLLLGACSAGSDTAVASDSMDTASSSSSWDSGAGQNTTATTEDTAAESAPSEPQEGLGSGGTAQTPAEPDPAEKLIYTAELTVETQDFDYAQSWVERLVGELGGYIERSDVSGNSRYESDGSVRIMDRTASYTLRVPADQFQDALEVLGAAGNVVQSATYVENVTSQFVDQEARQASLEVEEERLLELAAQAPDVETLIALESRLSEVRYEIESIERTLRNLQNQVDYSTVHLTIYEVAVYTPTAPVQRTFGERLGSAFQSGFEGFVDGCKNFVLWAASSLPALILLAAAVVVVVVVLRKRWKARHTPPKAPPREEPKDPPGTP